MPQNPTQQIGPSMEKPATELNRAEIKRKLLHLLALGIPFSIAYLTRPTAVYIFVSLAAAMAAGELLRQKIDFLQKLFLALFGTFVRPEEKTRFTGATYLFIAGAVCLVLFDMPIAYTVIGFMIVGDAAAALVGMQFGRIRISSGKSLEGTLACICTCLLFWALFPKLDFHMALAAAVLTGILEIIPQRINDNLIVPVVCGLVLQSWMGW
ncbi:MAG: hypothetical protein KGY38_04205 [Desulfobacterales bacterium]|nr:hypothetical protein [Desulfobacterales bacterium]